jgi:fatty-acid peroxygenase
MHSTYDLAPALLRHGYRAIARAREPHGREQDVFVSRLLGRRTVVVRGDLGARLLYDEQRIRRQGAVPRALAALLFGRDAVHGLDGAAHRARKRIFLDLLTPDSVDALAGEVDRGLGRAMTEWALTPSTRLHDGLVRVYGDAVLAWAGTACAGSESEDVSRDLAAIVAGFGFAGSAYPRAWRARRRADAWARDRVLRARRGDLKPPEGTALHAFSLGAGASLPVSVAAVDLLNVLRPTVAVSWLAPFAVLSLSQHPEWGRALLAPDGDRALEAFAHEVRRRTPFVPALTGLATTPFRAGSHEVRVGDRLLLDVPGTNLHADSWPSPTDFRPERFLVEEPGPYRFVPQGGGGPHGHRCPGEGVTTALLTTTLRHFAGARFTLVSPDVRTDTMPTLPSGGLVVRDLVLGANTGGTSTPPNGAAQQL